MKRQELAPAIAERCNTPMTLAEAERRLARPPTDEEVEETKELVRWFCRRYPTAKDRFAYVRRKYAEWTRNSPLDVEERDRLHAAIERGARQIERGEVIPAEQALEELLADRGR